jgi:hypothetical protein
MRVRTNNSGAGMMTVLIEDKMTTVLIEDKWRNGAAQILGCDEREKRQVVRALVTTFARLAQETSVPNWGGEDELAIALEDWEWVEKFAHRVAAEHPALPRPVPSPCGDGSVHLTWLENDGRRFVLEHKGDRMFFSSRDAQDHYLTGELRDEQVAVGQLVAFLS